MELDFVPTRRQIEAARLSIKYGNHINRPIKPFTQAVADWPLDKAADAARWRVS